MSLALVDISQARLHFVHGRTAAKASVGFVRVEQTRFLSNNNNNKNINNYYYYSFSVATRPSRVALPHGDTTTTKMELVHLQSVISHADQPLLLPATESPAAPRRAPPPPPTPCLPHAPPAHTMCPFSPLACPNAFHFACTYLH